MLYNLCNGGQETKRGYMKKLTEKQEAFCREYIKDLNQTQAAIRAGYAKSSATMQASRMIIKDDVSIRIAELLEKRNQETETDANYVLRRLREIDELDVIDILNEELDAFKPLKEWPKPWRQSISGIDLQHIISGGEEPIEKVIKKIKWPDKTKNLELIGRHVDVSAFKDRVEHKHVIEDMTDTDLERKIRELQSK